MDTIIVDLGSKEVKAGYGVNFPSEDEPRLVSIAIMLYVDILKLITLLAGTGYAKCRYKHQIKWQC